MSSLYVFFILASAFFVAQCQEAEHNEPKIHEHIDLGRRGCRSKDFKEQLTINKQAVQLIPRERFVTLNPENGFEYDPKAVVVKRCNGRCASRWSPIPIEVTNRTFHVMRKLEGSLAPPKCVTVTVEEHESCTCDCMRTSKDCNPKQYLDSTECICKCKNKDMEKGKCEVRYGMSYSDEDCACRCNKDVHSCPTGMTWNNDICMCVYERHWGKKN